MSKPALTLTIMLAMLFLATIRASFVSLADASLYLPTIVIKSDGSVEPETDLIKQTENVYSLTTNISQQYAIEIQCSNIVLDGGGHFVNGSLGPDYPYGYFNIGITLINVNNVTVKNVQVTGFANREIQLQDSTNCSIRGLKADFFELIGTVCNLNVIAESTIGNLVVHSSNNMFTRNNFTNSLFVGNCDSNSFVENNFLFEFTRFHFGVGDFWDNGSVGNYWSDYLVRFPDASARGDSGIGDTPYVIDANNTDSYPLMVPFETSQIEHQAEPEQEPFLILAIAGVIGVSAIVASIGYQSFNKKKRNSIHRY